MTKTSDQGKDKFSLLPLADIFPKQHEEQTKFVSIDQDEGGVLSIDSRSLNVKNDLFTIETIEDSIKNIEVTIGQWYGQKKYYEQLLEYAKEHGVPKDQQEFRDRLEKIRLKKQIKEFQEMKDRKIEDIATMKALKRKLKELENPKKESKPPKK